MEINIDELGYIKTLQEGLLKPLDKLPNYEELNDILDNNNFHGNFYPLPFFIFSTDKPKKLELSYNNIKVCDIKNVEYIEIDFEEACQKIFSTIDTKHPGVKNFLSNKGKYVISGYIDNYNDTAFQSLKVPYFLDLNKGKSTVFQSSNPPSVAHETIVKENAGDLLYTTVFSNVRSDQYSFEKKIKAYEVMKKIYNIEIGITVLPRIYAGSREALLNMLLMSNLGFKKFVVGRGKNCYKDFYDENEPLRIMKEYQDILNIEIQEQKNIFVNGKMVRGSEIKKMIDAGIQVPEELMSSYIYEVIK